MYVYRKDQKENLSQRFPGMSPQTNVRHQNTDPENKRAIWIKTDLKLKSKQTRAVMETYLSTIVMPNSAPNFTTAKQKTNNNTTLFQTKTNPTNPHRVIAF